MVLGQVQKVLVCNPSTGKDFLDLCPNGYSLSVVDAYVLDPASSSFFGELSGSFDYALLGQFFAFGFSSIIFFWGLGKGIGMIMNVLR